MAFIPISIDSYIKKHLKSNPSDNKKDVREKLNTALSDYNNGIKCQCGSDIWVIGAAFVGNSCFTCITGENEPSDDYEIDSAIKKTKRKKGQRNIDDLDSTKIAGIFDDDGYEINADLIKKPGLCMTCLHDNDLNEEMLCNMTRFDQQGEQKFKCLAYKKIDL